MMSDELGIGDNVEFYGSVADAMNEEMGVDMMLIPSRNEAASMVAMEAMACGIPVIASDTGGLPEIFDHGQAAALVTPDEPFVLADAIETLMADRPLRERYSRWSSLRYEARFTAARMVERTLAVYGEVMPRLGA